jgi:transposase
VFESRHRSSSRLDDLGVGRGDLSDEQWAVLKALLPVVVLGQPPLGRRKLIGGLRRRVRTGAPWKDLPSEYGSWQTVYGLFRRRQRDGAWPALLTRLQARADTAGLATWEVNVVSTICRAHQHAAGARHDGQAQKNRRAALAPSPMVTVWSGPWEAKTRLRCIDPHRCLRGRSVGGRRVRCGSGDGCRCGGSLPGQRCVSSCRPSAWAARFFSERSMP